MLKMTFIYISLSVIFLSGNLQLFAYADTLKNSDSTKLAVIKIINEVNNQSLKINNIHSESIIKIKTATYEQTGDLEIKLKKMNDLWLRISGSYAVFEKDAIFAYFTRDRFIFYDNLKETVINGQTNDSNITYLTRIKCSFDDLMNVMSNSVYITCKPDDSLNLRENDTALVLNVINLKGRVEYNIHKVFKYITGYSYFDNQNAEYLRFSFRNYSLNANGFYSKRIEIFKPSRNEYLKIFNTLFETNINNLNFEIKIPEDAKRIER